MKNNYDEIVKLVSDKLTEFEDDNSFAIMAQIDKDLCLPKGTTFDASGWKDYFDFYYDD